MWKVKNQIQNSQREFTRMQQLFLRWRGIKSQQISASCSWKPLIHFDRITEDSRKHGNENNRFFLSFCLCCRRGAVECGGYTEFLQPLQPTPDVGGFGATVTCLQILSRIAGRQRCVGQGQGEGEREGQGWGQAEKGELGHQVQLCQATRQQQQGVNIDGGGGASTCPSIAARLDFVQ
jgi:hypothetical protein